MTESDFDLTPEPSRFFRPIDWGAFWTACLVTFGVYFFTLAPTVTLEDSGELATGGDFLGVPHPPGYPIWATLAWVFARVFAFVPFRGHPNPAWAIGLMSAVWGALAAGISALLISRSGADILRGSDLGANVNRKVADAICWVSAVAASLLFSLSANMWSQSVIVEVYSLNAFFLVLVVLLVYRWLRRPSDRVLFATSFVFGLGLTNYQVLLLIGVCLAVAVMLRDLDLFRDYVITGLPFVAVLVLIAFGVLPEIRHPLHWTGLMYLGLDVLALVLVYFLLPRGRTVAVSFLLVQLGIAYYAYMPIVSDLRNPPMDWGYPRTWEGFKHAITRGQYEKITPSDIFSLQFIRQLGAYLTDLREQFTLLAAPLGFLAFMTWEITFGRRRVKALYAGFALTAIGVVMALVDRFVEAGSAFYDAIFRLLFAGVFVLMGIGGLTLALSQGRTLYLCLTGRTAARWSQRLTAGLILGGVLAGFLFYVTKLCENLVDILLLFRPAAAGSGGPAIVLVVKALAIIALILGPVALVAVLCRLMQGRFALRMTIDDSSQRWVMAILFGFATLSLILVSLADLKPDIQDMFIQRVKFISSHALFALWIGYGLIFVLAFVHAAFHGRAVVRWLSLGAALLLPAIPIHENGFNRELIRRYGGAEQNGHDFGWQFGNYGLRGAEAITEELAPDEEPLPNPDFPPPMTDDAIFYGGTDPGRFVPTYMIYCARVREDVYLITQNALADNTYLNVMRDLYGDRIWIPALPDSGRAFDRYVTEVQSGKRTPNAQLQIDNGRVQVSGALGVMEINGILAQMIFEHNNYGHDFYVEESYVIPWMYPYLSPHGLILKLNRESSTNNVTDSVVRDDTDFWDWYTRRLTANEKFRRDVVARKSFSKLRSAIGGLYANRGRFAEAENAFQEARLLYPLSPEANFRLVQEVLIQQRRFADAKRVIAHFLRLDPGNARVADFLRFLGHIERLDQRRDTLEAALRKGTMDMPGALELAEIYQQAGLLPNLLTLASSILNNPQLPPQACFRLAGTLSRAGRQVEMATALDMCMARLAPDAPSQVYLDIARMYAGAGRLEKTVAAMQMYVKREPADWQAWLDVTTLRLTLHEGEAAEKALEQAIRAGGEEALKVIRQDARFAPLRDRAISRAALPPPP